MKEIGFAAVFAGVLLSASAAAQVFVVDVANRAGTDFTDMPEAVAAVPDGSTLLVRAGQYTGFTLTGKGLKILGNGSTFMGPLRIASTTRRQLVMIRGVQWPHYRPVNVDSAEGPVIFQRCTRGKHHAPFAAPDLVVNRSANVQILDCNLATQTGSRAHPDAVVLAADSTLHVARSRLTSLISGRYDQPGTPAIRLLRARCTVVASTVIGGGGLSGCAAKFCFYDATDGGVGIHAEQSEVILIDTTVRGGDGGARSCLGTACTQPGDGGDGMFLRDSRVLIFGAEPDGGEGAPPTGQRGRPGTTRGNNTIRIDPLATPPSAQLIGSQQRGQSVTMRLTGTAGSTAVLIESTDATMKSLLPISPGSILANPGFMSAPLVIPNSGSLSASWPIPASFPLGQFRALQFVTLDPRGLWTTGLVPLIVGR